MGYNFSTTQRVIDGTGRILVGTVNPDAGYYMTEAQLKSYVLSALGQANGIATLDSSGKLTASQLPSTADDVQIVNPLPASGETGKLYVRTSDLTLWYWNGSSYTQLADLITQSLSSTDTTHAPSSKTVNDARALKQDALTFDNAPTENSTNPVTSGGVFTAINDLGLSVVNGQLYMTYDE